MSINILHIKNKFIDRQKWDNCIANSPQGNIYGYSWYLDCLGTWDAWVADDYRYCMPIFSNRKWLGLKQAYQPYFAQQQGLYTSEKNISPEIINEFIHIIKKYYFLINIHFNENLDFTHIDNNIFLNKINYILLISNPPISLQKNYSSSLKKRLNKHKPSHTITQNKLTPTELVAFYETNIGKKTGIGSYDSIKRIMEACMARNMGDIYAANLQDGSLGAAGFFPRSHGRIINLFGASSHAGRAHCSMHVLLDHVLEKGAEQSQVFDFEGSNIPSIAAFFESFGAKKTIYNALKYNYLTSIFEI